MVVDDDEFSQLIVQELLSRAGVCKMQAAVDGRDCLRTLEKMERAPDVLICDVYMPTMDGIELLSELAEQRFAGSVILITGVSIEMLVIALQIARASGLRILGVLTKPLSFDALTEVLRLDALQAAGSTGTSQWT
jgi:CheY-like chemotaxis protein